MRLPLKVALRTATALCSSMFIYARPACACQIPYCIGHPRIELITLTDGTLLRLQGMGINTSKPLAPAPYDGSRATKRS